MDFWKDYNIYYDNRIPGRLIKHELLIRTLREYSDIFNVNKVGESTSGKEIYKISLGKGEQNILLWSQMHGNEATATGAIMDILSFFKQNLESDFVKNVLTKYTLTFIPMLNPDGAANWTRVNQIGIDLNRDAVRKEAVESKILWKQIEDLNPYLSFNLHDQRNIFTAGNSNKTATISFLSASYNFEKDLNDNRRFQMWLIGELEKELSKNMAGHIGKYTDEFYPTATGDNLQKLGYNNILIESGTYPGDSERLTARRANFVSILKSLELISIGKISSEIDGYNSIPNNAVKLFDLLVKNVVISLEGNSSKVDLGIMYNESPNEDYSIMIKNSKIENIGDLSNFYGIIELDAARKSFKSEALSYPKLNQKASFSVGEIIIDNGEII